MIPVAFPTLSGNEAKYVEECVRTTWISSVGHFITDFETAFAQIAGTEHVIATNNGTTALHLALVAAGVGPGDEVIVPTLTYVATANAVRYCGATPVLAEVEPDSMCLDPDDFERRITPATKAVVPVHLFGQPADMPRIVEIARRHGITVVEDAAEAHGATVDGQPVGSWGDLGVFSFFGNKILTTGEGGAVTTHDADLAARLRRLRGQGMDPERRYWFPEVGFNYRMTNIAAALGLAQAERFAQMLAERDRIGARYAALLATAEGITLPTARPGTRPVTWLYTVLLDGLTTEQRNTVIDLLLIDGIETRPVFYPMHVMPPYATEPTPSFPVSERLAAEGITLPTHLELSDADIVTVSKALAARTAEVRA